jgi:uncharacterized protein involved in exopolysaccharide biosynthesis
MSAQPIVDPSVAHVETVVGPFEPTWVGTVTRRRWVWVLAIGVICAATAGVRALIAPRVYRAETLVTATSPTGDKSGARDVLSGNIGGLAALAGVSLGGDSFREEAIAYLRSNELAREFIAQTRSADEICEFGRGFLAPLYFSTCKGTSAEDALRAFDRTTRFVVEDRRTGLLSLRIDWRDPKLAAEWSNAYVRLANKKLRERAIAEGEARLSYLEAELSKSHEIELRQAVARVIESTLNTEMMARVQDEYAFRVIDPAMPTSLKRYVRPNLPVEMFVALVLGATTALVFFLLRDRNRHVTPKSKFAR